MPLRELGAGFGSTVKATVPSPVPLLPFVIVIHPALLVAVQAQPVLVVTDAVEDVPVATMLCGVGPALKLQTIPACVNTNV